jgi:hypothetical protein
MGADTRHGEIGPGDGGGVEHHGGEDERANADTEPLRARLEDMLESNRSCGVEDGIRGHEVIATAFDKREEDERSDVEDAEQAKALVSEERD